MGKNLSYKQFYPLLGSFYREPVIAQRAPGNNDKNYDPGQVWVDQPNDDNYMLTRFNAGLPVWIGIGGGAGTFSSLTVSPGNLIVSSGSISAGTTISSTGAITAGNGLTVTTGGATISAGNLAVTLGNLTTGGSITAGSTLESTTSTTVGNGLTVSAGTVTVSDLSTAGVITNTVAGVLQSSAGSNGQILLGSTGSAPAWGSLASADGSITFTTGPNSLDLSASGVDMTINTDGSAATEASNAFAIIGTTNEIVTSGAGSTVTIAFPANPQISDTLTIGTGLTISAGGIDSVGDVKTYGELIAEADTADAAGEKISVQKSRSGGVINTGDALGQIGFWGQDGSAFIAGAYIKSTSSGTIATNRIPANMEFYTHPDSTTVAQLRMSIDTTGEVTIADPDSGTGLTVAGGGMKVTLGDIEVEEASKGVILGSGLKVIDGSGSPDTVVTAPKGSLYLRTDGSTTNDRMYVNTDGSTGWSAVTTAS